MVSSGDWGIGNGPFGGGVNQRSDRGPAKAKAITVWVKCNKVAQAYGGISSRIKGNKVYNPHPHRIGIDTAIVIDSDLVRGSGFGKYQRIGGVGIKGKAGRLP